jgi:NADH-quinone oxidoreductase subunit J
MLAIFYMAAAVAVLAAMAVVFQRTPVYSALSLIVVLGALAVVYLLLDAPFIAMIQVIVYAGAIMVLFVLVIMLLNARPEEPTRGSRFAHWLGVPLLIVFFGEFSYLIFRRFPARAAPSAADASPEAIGHLLFRSYVLPFEVTSILILVAILGAVVLAKKQL